MAALMHKLYRWVEIDQGNRIRQPFSEVKNGLNFWFFFCLASLLDFFFFPIVCSKKKKSILLIVPDHSLMRNDPSLCPMSNKALLHGACNVLKLDKIFRLR